jgi:hypothetical protein
MSGCIPAMVKSAVESLSATSDAEGSMAWPRSCKNVRNDVRNRSAVNLMPTPPAMYPFRANKNALSENAEGEQKTRGTTSIGADHRERDQGSISTPATRARI